MYLLIKSSSYYAVQLVIKHQLYKLEIVTTHPKSEDGRFVFHKRHLKA